MLTTSILYYNPFDMNFIQDCFRSLLSLLQWSWATFKCGLVQTTAVITVPSSSTASHLTALQDLERLVYISRASLRLIKTYINEIYPNQGRGWRWFYCYSPTYSRCKRTESVFFSQKGFWIWQTQTLKMFFNCGKLNMFMNFVFVVLVYEIGLSTTMYYFIPKS